MTQKLFAMLSVLILLASAAGGAQASAPEDGDINFSDYMPELTDFTLPNGLRVILAQDHSAPVVAVDVWYHVGGANDPEDRSGFAHLFEHMMFEGSEHVGNDEFHALLEEIGANNNAYTASDNTAYWAVAPANELPRVLWLESDRMASLNVSQEAFDTQRDVVIEEYNQRVANAPYGVSNRRLFTLPMQGYPPYARPVIGSVEDLEAASLAEVRDFHDTYYRPNNATLVIVGDIDVEQTTTLVQAYFGDIPGGEPLVPITQTWPLPDEFPVLRTDDVTGCSIGYEETRVDPLVELPRYGATVVGPPRGAPDFYAVELLTDILSGGDSSRMEQNIVRQGKAAAAFTGFADNLGGSLIYTIGYPNSGDSPEDAQALIRAEFDKIIEDGVTEEELDRVKKQKLVGAITSFRESTRSTAEWIQDAVLAFGDPTAMLDEMARYQAVTTDDIQRVAQEYLCNRPASTLITLPEGEEVLADDPGLLVEPQKLTPVEKPASNLLDAEPTTEALAALPEGVINRTGVPAPLPVAETSFPPFETFTLENGLEVIFVEQHELPQVNAQLYVRGSNAAAPAEQQGVADFVAELLTKGTETRTAADIAGQIEAVGGSVGSNAALEWISLSVDALRTDADLAFDLLGDMARNPTFPDNELEVIREQTLTFLEQDAVSPDTLANHQFGRIAYGGHPYGFYATPETVKNLTRDDVVDFYTRLFKPNNALLVVVGDMTLDEAQAQVERVFADWEPGDVPDVLDYPAANVGDTSVIYLIDRPDSEQATIQVGNRAINARTPERYALSVVNSVLGGGASSRLFSNLREDKGYTYGVYSRFGRPNDTSTFRVLTDVGQNHAGDAITEILYELNKIRTRFVTAEELADAKGLLIGNFALSIEDPADFARQLSTRRLTGVPIDELNSYLQKLEDVSAAEARRAARKYIDAKSPIIVVVGNAEVIRPQLEELGQVVQVDADGNPVESE
ncbi:MAG: insulinase family protein [Chloroflexi bacterium]|nr:MAG: insulinase family protein [Chloroflexota bacterium]